MKTQIILVVVSLCWLSITVASQAPERVYFQSSNDQIQLEGFLYSSENPSNAKGVIIFIGGSGFTKGGYGGPSIFSHLASKKGFISFEWNKRGIRTNSNYNGIEVDKLIYGTANFDNILLDAQAALNFIKSKYSSLPLFIVGGSEGSVTTTLLAEHNPKSIAAISTFGNIVSPFMMIAEKQMTEKLINDFWDKYDLDKNNKLDVEEYIKLKNAEDTNDAFRYPDFESIDITNDGLISKKEASRFFLNYFVNNQQSDLDKVSKPKEWLASMLKIPSLLVRAEKIMMPVLILQGEDDINTPIDYAYLLEIQCRALGYDNFNFKYYSGVGHAPNEKMFGDFISFFEDQIKSLKSASK